MKRGALSFFICSLILAASAANTLKIRGMTPGDLSLLDANAKTFRCRDGSKTIPISQVNDDFCDCEGDGSDEPGTSACPKGSFYCRNIGSVGKSVFSSQVGDGICDCCDGSDEKLNPRSTCKNVCAAEAREANKGKQQELDLTNKGLAIKREYIAKAERELSEKRSQKNQFEEELQNLKSQREREMITRDRLQQEENDARTTLQPPAPEQTPPPAEEQQQQEGENTNNEEFQEGDYQEGDGEYVDEPAAATTPAPTPAAEPVDEKLQAYIDATRKQQDVVTGLDNQISGKENEIRDIEKRLSINFGDKSAFYGIYGQCFNADTPEYTYELCPFDKVNQNSKRGGGTLLGNWKEQDQNEEWTKHHRQMKYTEGVRCWGGPDRSAVVNILCGAENVLSNPSEPNKCEYHLTFHTPAACSDSRAQFLKLELNGGGHAEEEEDPEAAPKAGWSLF